MIYFLTSHAHAYTHEELAKRADVRVEIQKYPDLFGRNEFPSGTYIFTDFDRVNATLLTRLAKLYRQFRDLDLPVLNDPARWLSRYGLLRRLHHEGINDFNAYRVESCEEVRRWPVFLRSEGNHDKPLTELLANRAELDLAIAEVISGGTPVSALLVVEYAAEEVRPGLFRKLSVYRVGDRMIGYTCVHDDNWLVKYGKPGLAPAELYDEEYLLVRDNPYGETMRRVFDLAGAEYGRVDFGLIDGKPQIYEINTNPNLQLEPKPIGIAQRDRSNKEFQKNYLEALRVIDPPR